ncbi:Protein phosphatase 2A regulatory subunit PR55 like protein [Aduncisulcus paluster]|uniref:Serine/threonine-protein phosphatase 2A 55 kDa regulatory subunit B n=1 Tax=Aduncisulcus paluster TaxID=2918883 RepID=A0ABQ5K8M1_9EUKA|nr:Protein phosphatase 2A regulatory subunit PR55 like protein [Aduncisulcus paluster]
MPITRINGSKIRLSQLFGESTPSTTLSNICENDIVTVTKFSNDGKYLVVGDKGGRCICFEKQLKKRKRSKQVEFRFICEFQAHSKSFDALRSQSISESITALAFVPTSYKQSQFLLSANSSSTKLWKISDKITKEITLFNTKDDSSHISSLGQLRLPHIRSLHSCFAASHIHDYTDTQGFRIHSLSFSADHNVFLSADDLRIHLWSLERPDTCFNVVDLKPEDMADLSELITTAKFHPSNSNIFMYGTSNGSVRLLDTRVRCLHDKPCLYIHKGLDMKAGTADECEEAVSSIHDLAIFNHKVFVRDFASVKIYDFRRTLSDTMVSMQPNPLAARSLPSSSLAQSFSNPTSMIPHGSFSPSKMSISSNPGLVEELAPWVDPGIDEVPPSLLSPPDDSEVVETCLDEDTNAFAIPVVPSNLTRCSPASFSPSSPSYSGQPLSLNSPSSLHSSSLSIPHPLSSSFSPSGSDFLPPLSALLPLAPPPKPRYISKICSSLPLFSYSKVQRDRLCVSGCVYESVSIAVGKKNGLWCATGGVGECVCLWDCSSLGRNKSSESSRSTSASVSEEEECDGLLSLTANLDSVESSGSPHFGYRNGKERRRKGTGMSALFLRAGQKDEDEDDDEDESSCLPIGERVDIKIGRDLLDSKKRYKPVKVGDDSVPLYEDIQPLSAHMDKLKRRKDVKDRVRCIDICECPELGSEVMIVGTTANLYLFAKE